MTKFLQRNNDDKILDTWVFSYLHGSLHKLFDLREKDDNERQMGDEPNRETFAAALGTTCDRMMNAVLLVALEAQHHFAPMANAYFHEQIGVLAYDHLDVPDTLVDIKASAAYPAWLFLHITPEQWFEVAENNTVPVSAISAITQEWAIKHLHVRDWMGEPERRYDPLVDGPLPVATVPDERPIVASPLLAAPYGADAPMKDYPFFLNKHAVKARRMFAYVEGFDVCPTCKGRHMSWDNLELDGNTVRQEGVCTGCSEAVVLLFQLRGVELVEPSDGLMPFEVMHAKFDPADPECNRWSVYVRAVNEAVVQDAIAGTDCTYCPLNAELDDAMDPEFDRAAPMYLLLGNVDQHANLRRLCLEWQGEAARLFDTGPMYACPNCKSTDHLMVSAVVAVSLIQKGEEYQTDFEGGDHEWGGDSAMWCTSCGCSENAACFFTNKGEA